MSRSWTGAIVSITLFGGVCALLIVDCLITLYPYSWSEEPTLAGRADADSAFAIVWISVVGLALAIAAYSAGRVWWRGSSRAATVMGDTFLALAACGFAHRLVQAVRHYNG